MNTGWKRTQISAVFAVLVMAGLAGAATGQELEPNGTAEAAREVTPTTSPPSAKPLARVGEFRPPELGAAPIVSVPPEDLHPAPELIHQATFSAAGVVEKGARSIRLIGVAATALDAQCGTGPDVWPCGRVGRAALQRFVRRRLIECRSAEVQAPDDIARCTVGGTDIGEWLVSQGWAKAEGPDYAEVERTARDEKRGIWSPVRPGLALDPNLEVGPTPANATVFAQVDLSSQSMTLIHRGRIVAQWPVSTARDGKETPTGMWTAKWLARDHRSSLYNDARMPYSVFYDGDYAVHGTYETDRLGRPASAGCVRLDTQHAAVLFNLVREEGLGNTVIVVRH